MAHQKHKPIQPGDRFTRLRVLRDLGLRPNRNGFSNQRWWLCACDCGSTIETTTRTLNYKSTKSCGCYGLEQRRKGAIKALTRHGYAAAGSNRAPEYNVFATMHARCYNPNNEKYQRYGKRGIAIDDRWHKFENFIADMGQRPSPAHQIERRDNNGNYGPSNCKWATPTEQARNRSSNRLITIDGVTECVAKWAETSNLRQGTLLARLNSGWSTDRLLLPLIRKPQTAT